MLGGRFGLRAKALLDGLGFALWFHACRCMYKIRFHK